MTGSQMQLGNFAPELKPGLSQFHTPEWLAKRMVAWVRIKPGMRVLEPSAGGGNIVRELLAVGAAVTACEIDPAWAAFLREHYPSATVVEGDFLGDCRLGEFDLAVGNPPLNGGDGPVHVARALKFAPRMISVLRAHDLHGVEAFETLWKDVFVPRVAHCIRRPKFGKGSPLSEFVVADVSRDPRASGAVQWW